MHLQGQSVNKSMYADRLKLQTGHYDTSKRLMALT